MAHRSFFIVVIAAMGGGGWWVFVFFRRARRAGEEEWPLLLPGNFIKVGKFFCSPYVGTMCP